MHEKFLKAITKLSIKFLIYLNYKKKQITFKVFDSIFTNFNNIIQSCVSNYLMFTVF